MVGNVIATRRQLGLAAMIAIVLAVIPGVRGSSTPIHAMDADFAETVPCGGCDICELDQGGYGHITTTSAVGRDKLGPNGAHPDDCQTGNCDTEHPPQQESDCDRTFAVGDPPEVEQFWFEVRQSDGPQLKALLTRVGDFASVNLERQAVQLLGCSSVPIAHIPLTDEQAASLAE